MMSRVAQGAVAPATFFAAKRLDVSHKIICHTSGDAWARNDKQHSPSQMGAFVLEKMKGPPAGALAYRIAQRSQACFNASPALLYSQLPTPPTTALPHPTTVHQVPLDLAQHTLTKAQQTVALAGRNVEKERLKVKEEEGNVEKEQLKVKCLERVIGEARNLTTNEYQLLLATTDPVTSKFIKAITTIEPFTMEKAELKLKEAKQELKEVELKLKEAKQELEKAELKLEKAKQELKEAELSLLTHPKEIEEFLVRHLQPSLVHTFKVISQQCLDPRSDSLKFFDKYMAMANNEIRHIDTLSDDNNRVPLCANTGTAGSGKTTMLFLVCEHFERKYRGKAIYITFHGIDSPNQSVDKDLAPGARIALRVLMKISANSTQLNVFIDSLCAKCSRSDLGKTLTTGNTLSRIVRRVLQLDAATPLLLAIDELRKMGDLPDKVYTTSEAAVNGLVAAAAISTLSFVEHMKAKAANVTPVEPTYICASAYAAYDPAKGITNESGRRVVYLPLPPLKLELFEKELFEIKKDHTELLRCRHLLWLAQGNARTLCTLVNSVVGSAVDEAAYTGGAVNLCETGRLKGFLDACTEKNTNPMNLVTSVFWPTMFAASTAFDDYMAATLYAEAAGLCCILRGSTTDKVFIHPKALLAVCTELGRTCTPIESRVLALVKELCELLCQLPAMPNTAESGKLYERIILQAMVCRAATTRSPTLTVGELLGYPVSSNKDDPLSTEVVPPTLGSLKKVAVEVFPLAFSSAASVSEPCSPMPMEDEVPWYTDLDALHKYNCVVDSMMCLAVAGSTDKRSVTIGFQNKELKDVEKVVGAFRSRNCLTKHGYSGNASHSRNINKHLAKSTFIHVLVTPNTPPSFQRESFEVKARYGGGPTFKCEEALITHDSIREWCPMVAYSGCDARVLTPITPDIPILTKCTQAPI